jgi:hypothetical protein
LLSTVGFNLNRFTFKGQIVFQEVNMDELTALAAAETAPLDETTPNGELVSLSQNFLGLNLRGHDIEHNTLAYCFNVGPQAIC